MTMGYLKLSSVEILALVSLTEVYTFIKSRCIFMKSLAFCIGFFSIIIMFIVCECLYDYNQQ